MMKDKMRTFLEILYNCPFILLVLVTSMVVIPFSSDINICKNVKETAAMGFGSDGLGLAARQDNSSNKNVKGDKSKRNSDRSAAESQENIDAENGNTTENAGICKESKDVMKEKAEQKNDIQELDGLENKGKIEYGTTEFVPYTPVNIESRYYSDAGKVALTTDYDYIIENESYFNDAAFLGDSRTLGISDYAGLDGADFYCDNGMTIYKLLGDEGVTYQKTGEKVDMKEVLQEKHYGKVYIMLGMNELGYGNTLMYLKQYLKVIRQIREWQPGVTIYIMGNLHVSREKNNPETEFNNININDKNVASARLANGRDVFYLDCNPLFTDEEGFLREDLTFDGVHLYAQHYDKWRDFLFSHGVEREREETMTAAAQGGEGYGTDKAE